MKIYGLGAVGDFLGDFIVYRNLIPMDSRLGALRLPFPGGVAPRKSDPAYGDVVARLLREARKLETPTEPIERLVFIGDTRLLDGTAFDNLCAAGGWPGLAFIGSEDNKPAAVEVTPSSGGQTLYLSNRWAALAGFAASCEENGFPLDERTAVVVDLDKTTVGARGRNAGPIDAARVEAVEVTVAGLLGTTFDPAAFRQAYDLLNQPEFHPFTADNQDYLAYVCLILGSGLIRLDDLKQDIRSGRWASFGGWIVWVDEHSAQLSSELQGIHRELYRFVQAGDPTPFKPFRRNEYRLTAGRFGCLPEDAPVEAILAWEIAITQEVRRFAMDARGEGALLFGLSDKPDEASIPTLEMAAEGWQPLHRARTHIVGE